MNDKKLHFSGMNDIVNDKKGHNIVNDSFAHKPDGSLVSILERMECIYSNYYCLTFNVSFNNCDLLVYCVNTGNQGDI